MIEHHTERGGPARDALVHKRDLVAVPERRSDRILGDRGKLTRFRGDAIDREQGREVGRVLGERSILDVHCDRGDHRCGSRVRLVEPGRVDGGIRRANAKRDLAVAKRVGGKKNRDRTNAIDLATERGARHL